MTPMVGGGLDILVINSGTPHPSLVLFWTEVEIYLYWTFLHYKFLQPWPVCLPPDQKSLISVRIRVQIRLVS